MTLAEYLGVDITAAGNDSPAKLEDIADAKSFGVAVMNSYEFRRYILMGLQLGNVPGFSSVLLFLLAHAAGKPVERVEHTGKDGQPIQTITEVRRVIVRTPKRIAEEPVESPSEAVH